MGTLTEKVNDYFASLNPLANMIIKETNLVKKKCGEEWHNLSIEQQEEILDNHFIDPEVKKDYPQKEDVPICYPKLKINCGENIVADFDDGSMWRDEHSGPFSWYSLSQQDLTILDPVEFAVETEENAADGSPKKGGKGKKKKKKGKKGKGSAAATDDELCTEENNVEPQQNHIETKAEVTNPDEIKAESSNRSISLSPSKMSSLKSQVKKEEETKLLDSSFESGADNEPAKGEVKQPVKPKKKKVKVPKAAPPPPPVDKRWKKQDQQSGDIEETLISEKTAEKSTLKLVQDSEGGMVSGVFIHEVGESSTDPEPAINSQPPKTSVPSDLGANKDPGVAIEAGAVGGQINLAMDEEESVATAKTEPPSEAEEKSGFDFLLDW